MSARSEEQVLKAGELSLTTSHSSDIELMNSKCTDARMPKPDRRIFLSALSSMEVIDGGNVPQWLPRLNEVVMRLWLESLPSKLNADGSALICASIVPELLRLHTGFQRKQGQCSAKQVS